VQWHVVEEKTAGAGITSAVPVVVDKVNVEKMFPLVGKTRARGHNLRLKGRSFKTEMRRNLFSQRVVNSWNSLPQRGCGGQITECL